MSVEYVVGLMFTEKPHRAVVLQTKCKPAWQRGRLNGPGGKIEPGESAAEAVSREIREECGIDLPAERWRRRILLHGDGWQVVFFAADISLVQARAAHDFAAALDEPLSVIAVGSAVHEPTLIPNLRWIIPFCIDPDVEPCEVRDSSLPQVTPRMAT